METATVSGRVLDTLGNPIPATILTLENRDTGRTATSKTAQRGSFRFDFVPPGEYLLKVHTDYYYQDESSFTLHIGDHREVEFTLLRFYEMQGDVVEADRSIESLRDESVSYVVEEEEIDRLPYKRREYQNLAVLAPGVKRGFITPITVFDLDVISMSGRDGSSVIYYADGVDNNDFAAGLPVMEFPQESIQEFQVGTHRLGVDNGGSAGGFINVLTKSGTNRWKGSFFSYVKSEDFMALDHFMEEAGVNKPDLTTTQFGASIGGPINIDRTHLFAAYEGTRGEDEFLMVNTGGAFPEFEGAFSRPVREDLLFLKLTHRISDSKNLTVRYNQQNSMMRRLDAGGVLTIDNSRWEDVDKYMVLAKYDWYVSSGFSSQLNGYYGWSRRHSEAKNPDSPVLRSPSVITGSNGFAPFEHTAGKIGFGGDILFGNQGRLAAHSLKAGFQYQRVSTEFMNDRLKNGRFDYYMDDFESPPARFTFVLGDSAVDMGRNAFSLYLEDDWVVTNRLRLVSGVRYDVETGMLKDYSDLPALHFLEENYDELSETLASDFPELGLDNGYRALEPDADNVAPRIGATYDLTGRGTVILRGGWGLYYDSIYDLYMRAIALQNSNRPQLSYIILFPEFGPDSLPDFTDMYDPSGKGADLFFPSPDLETPYTHQSSVGVALSFLNWMTLEVDYVNAIGRNELKQRNINYQSDGNRVLSDEYGNIIVLESIGTSRYDALLTQFVTRISDSFSTRLSYTLSRTRSSQDGYTTRPQDNLKPLSWVEYGPTRHDATHSLNVGILTKLPGSFECNSFLLIESPRPYTVLTGFDDNGDGLWNDMPDGVHRNSERGDWTLQWDVRISKFFRNGRWGQTELLVDFLNITNTANFGNFYFNKLTSESFGEPTKVFTPPRHVQVGLRHTF